MIGTLTADGRDVTFGTVKKEVWRIGTSFTPYTSLYTIKNQYTKLTKKTPSVILHKCAKQTDFAGDMLKVKA